MTKKDNKRRIAFEYEKEQAKRTKKERPQREVREKRKSMRMLLKEEILFSKRSTVKLQWRRYWCPRGITRVLS